MPGPRGRPRGGPDADRIRALLAREPQLTDRQVAERLGVARMTVWCVRHPERYRQASLARYHRRRQQALRQTES